MPTEPSFPLRIATALVCALVAVVRPAGAQAPLYLVDPNTRVHSVRFRVEGTGALAPERLRSNTALDGPGRLPGVRGALDFLPGISAPTYELFSPLTLQRDVARLRRLYGDEGFPGVEVDYDVVLDTATNRVDVTFLLTEGRPLVIAEVRLPQPDRGATDAGWLHPELREGWERYREDLRRRVGRRFGMQERASLENSTADWLRDRGYPWARALIASADTLADSVHVSLEVRAGPRARVDTVLIEGLRELSYEAVRREVPIMTGEWYSNRDVAGGQREIYELEMVRRALGDVPDDQPRDSTVTVRYRIDEGRPRLIWGRVGYRTQAGAVAEVHWSHRNFFGAARTLTASGVAETAWGALEQASKREYGLSVAVRQPFVGHRRFSASAAPFVRFRDDFRDRSLQYGLATTLLYQADPLKRATVQHEFSRRRVDDVLQLGHVRDVVEQGDSVFEPWFVTSVFRVAGSYGRLDDRLSPRTGYLVSVSADVAGPSGISDVEYFRSAVEVVHAVPVSRRVGFFLRASAGRMLPFGASDPAPGEGRERAFVGLREAMFTAGGTGDVRGWGSGLLGPKIPDVRVGAEGEVLSDRFSPVGGLARLTGHAELILPFPLLPRPHSTHVFADAGRVWSPGTTFDPADPELALEDWGYSVGAGIQIATLVGPLRLSLGYKLNPDPVDLLPPGMAAAALASGTDLRTLDLESRRRWHLHLAIGRSL